MIDRAEIDWNVIWKERYTENIRCRSSGECASIWESREKARTFLNKSRESPDRINHLIGSLPFKPESKVLDIGAGPGTLAVPLAGLVSHVTAVEPAAGMAEVMAEYAKEEGVSNLAILRKRWEDIDPSVDLGGQYDIVVAAYSLGMPDIKAAVEAMCEASSRWVYIFWFAGTTSWEQVMVDLWPKIHRMEYQRGPKADVLFNVLYSMGIFPNVEISKMEHVNRFSDFETAVAEFREDYGISNTEQEVLLQEYLSGALSENGGDLLLSGMTTRVKLWWEVKGR